MAEKNGYLNEDSPKLLQKLEEELKLRKYSSKTIKNYGLIAENFLKSGKTSREYLLRFVDYSNSRMRGIYFALQFLYEKVLHQEFKEELPLAQKSHQLPVILNQEEISLMMGGADYFTHRLLLMFLYYGGLRLEEVRSLKWEDFGF